MSNNSLSVKVGWCMANSLTSRQCSWITQSHKPHFCQILYKHAKSVFHFWKCVLHLCAPSTIAHLRTNCRWCIHKNVQRTLLAKTAYRCQQAWYPFLVMLLLKSSQLHNGPDCMPIPCLALPFLIQWLLSGIGTVDWGEVARGQKLLCLLGWTNLCKFYIRFLYELWYNCTVNSSKRWCDS